MIHVAVAHDIDADHTALPEASEVSTLHTQPHVESWNPSNDHVQRTSSVYHGVAVQIHMNTPDWKSREA